MQMYVHWGLEQAGFIKGFIYIIDQCFLFLVMNVFLPAFSSTVAVFHCVSVTPEGSCHLEVRPLLAEEEALGLRPTTTTITTPMACIHSPRSIYITASFMRFGQCPIHTAQTPVCVCVCCFLLLYY